ncbi:MAG: ABC transporter substrate-binding protein [archaeon]
MTGNKPILVFVLLVVLALAVVSVGWIVAYQGHVVSEGSKSVKVGLIGIFSGEYASYGVPMKNAIELYVDDVNAHGGIDGKQIELIVEDNAGDSAVAASAINKLIHVDNVNYILSAQGSGLASVVAPIAQDNGRIMMITLGSAPGLAKTGDYIFRSVPSDAYQAVKMNDFLVNDLGARKVAVLYTNDAYGEGIKNKINDNANVRVVANEMFEQNAADFRTQLLKIKESGADALVIVAHTEYASIIKQITELDLNIPIVASETFKDEGILKDVGTSGEGVYVTFMKESTDHFNFAEKYAARFGEEPSAFSMYAYDGAVALVEAIDAAGDDVEGVRLELYKVKFEGASGSIGFDSDGDRTGTEYSIYEVRGGEFVLV